MVLSAEFIGYTNVAVSLIGAAVYIISVFKGVSKPHVFTWFIWGLISAIICFAQYTEAAGPGAWLIGVNAITCTFISILGLKFGKKNIARSDWLALIAALAAIIPWVVCKDPMWSVILITFIDVVAFWPTLRKSWHYPHDENLFTYNLAAANMYFSLFAIQNFNLTTALFPISAATINIIFTIGATLRRKQLLKLQQP